MKQRGVAVIGAIALLPIAWGLVQHTLSIPEAAKRALAVVVVLWLVETMVLPLLAPMFRPAANASAGGESAPDGQGGA